MTQATHISGAQTQYNKEIVLGRGNDMYYDFEHGSLMSEISRITFTARQRASGSEDGLGTVVMQLTSSDQPTQFTYDEEDKKSRVSFLDTDTDGLRAANNDIDLVYDIEILHSDGSIYTAERGSLRVEYDVTHDDSTAAYLSWTTMGDLEDEIDGYAAAFDRTFLYSAASAGATTIYVLNSSVLDVGDDIRIILNDGTYDQRTIATITEGTAYDTITFSGGLTTAAAANSVVMKVI